MRPGDDPQDAAHELRVTDRRRFTSSGDFRSEGEAATEESAAPPAPRSEPTPVAPPSEPSRQPEPERPRGGMGDVHDLGIESVFLIFHQSALISLGATHPGGPPGHVDLAEARQAITFLKVLEEKTRGNLTEDEAAMLRDLMSEAQMAYVQVARAGGGTA